MQIGSSASVVAIYIVVSNKIVSNEVLAYLSIYKLKHICVFFVSFLTQPTLEHFKCL